MPYLLRTAANGARYPTHFSAVLVDAGPKTFSYLYVFGDGWSHTVKLERSYP